MPIDNIYNQTSGLSPSSLLTEKGSIVSHNGTSSFSLSVGSDNTKLTANSTETIGLSWSTASTQSSASFSAIASAVITANTATVLFSAIPGTYSHLMLVGTVRANVGSTAPFGTGKINGATSQYHQQYLRANGSASTISSAVQSTGANLDRIIITSTTDAAANVFGFFEIFYPNYASGRKKQFFSKSFGQSGSSTENWGTMIASGYYDNVGAITSISVSGDSYGGFVANSVITLYAMK
jgi:hypothetical protein